MIKLENYKIIKKIAPGGMGDVYLAEHIVLEKKFAIKSLHPELVRDESFRKRFRKEARIQSRLSHPNIVKLIDFQECPGGLYLIMEYVDGKQLNDYIQKVSGPIPEKELIPLFLQILSAIKYAHSKGLIHRDIKPSNILITAEGHIKVIDFGIAKSSDEDKGLTKTGVQVGTVSYMSPEQVRATKVDLLTDIYSLGVTLFQAAVGQAPYAEQTNTFEIQLSIVNDPLPNAKDIYPSITKRLIKIIEKATQKKKSDRYQSCEEFIKSFKEKPVKKKLNKTTEIIDTKKPRKKSKKITLFKNRKVRLSIYTIIALLISGFGYKLVLEPIVIPQVITWNEERKEAAEEKRKKAADDKKAADYKKAAKDKRKKAAAAEAERIRIANLNNGRLGPINLSNGDVYEGDWVRGERTGKGILKIAKDNNTYSGSFKNNKFEGYGVYKWADGDSYEGNFKNNLQEGGGTYIDNDGVRHPGNWKNGKEILPFITISGKVRDVKGAPLFGATIMIKETFKKVSTDSKGQYTIKVQVGQTIIASYRGLKNQTTEIIDGRKIFSPILLK